MLLAPHDILPARRMKDGKIRLLLESPKEQFPASALVML
jgi:hypothetical protein